MPQGPFLCLRYVHGPLPRTGNACLCLCGSQCSPLPHDPPACPCQLTRSSLAWGVVRPSLPPSLPLSFFILVILKGTLWGLSYGGTRGMGWEGSHVYMWRNPEQ